jgi:hypothetical protein
MPGGFDGNGFASAAAFTPPMRDHPADRSPHIAKCPGNFNSSAGARIA